MVIEENTLSLKEGVKRNMQDVLPFHTLRFTNRIVNKFTRIRNGIE